MSSTADEGTKHARVRRYLEAAIGHGLEPHKRLPTERNLAEELGVNRLTVRRALDEMERDGTIYRVRGAGTFVSARRISKTFELNSFSEDMRIRNLRPGSQSIQLSLVPAGQTAGYALGLSPASSVVRIQRIRTADDIPICLEDSYLPAGLVPGLESGIRTESLYEDLSERYGLRPMRADQIIEAVVLEEESATQLVVPAFSPAFRVKRTTYDTRSKPIEYAESVYRGDRYSYEVSISRAVPKGSQ